MSFNLKHRYSAVAVLSEDLERIVLIHKQKPAWQAGRANVPGGKVEGADVQTVLNGKGHYRFPLSAPWPVETYDAIHLVCAARELREETGLDITATALQLFCRLRFKTPEGDAAECYFYAATLPCKGRDLDDHVRTMETEHVFCSWISDILNGEAIYSRQTSGQSGSVRVDIPTLANIPYIVAMARQCLRSEGAGSWPLTVYEAAALL